MSMTVLAETVNESLYNFKFEIGRREAIVMLFTDMNNELWSKSADGHSDNIFVWDNSFDSAEQTKEGITRQYVIKISIGQQ